jgi:phosphoribosylformimino-5-aminoimidazole carboxamide ribonucleotide (ProFAR) isomerase
VPSGTDEIDEVARNCGECETIHKVLAAQRRPPRRGKLGASDAPCLGSFNTLQKPFLTVIVIPTTELRGSLVYAPGGQPGAGSRSPVDAAGIHRAFAALGFRQIHLHDIDADSGRDDNEALIAEIVRDAAAEVLVSGGVLAEERVDRLIDAGVSQVIFSSTDDDDRDALLRLAEAFPGRLILRADLGDPIFGRRAGRHHAEDMVDLATELSSLPLGGLAVHGASPDGFQGAPRRYIEDLVEAASVPVFCRTEAASIGELRALEHLGIAATVLGSSLFNGRLDAQAVAHHFDS